MMQGEPFLPENLEGWLAVLRNIALGALAAVAILWRTVDRKIDHRAKKIERRLFGEDGDHGEIGDLREDMSSAFDTEREHRELADRRIEDVIARNAQLLHNYMGKVDLMVENLGTIEKERIREMSDLREELRVGFAKIEGKLDRQYSDRQGP